MSTLKVATIQSSLHWENPEANLHHFAQHINQLQQQADLIVLPEMFTTGFSMNTALAETPDGEAMRWMHQMAEEQQAAVCGSLMMHTKHQDVYNRLVWMNPSGTYHYYNKRHLFSIGQEHLHYKAGTEKTIVQLGNFRIQLLVCYDLRFPVWIRRSKQEDYDAIVIVANWPERRAEHWKALLRARAIENQCYVVAVNRVGLDGNGVNHSGDTSIIDPMGQVVYTKAHEAETHVHTLDLEAVTRYRSEFGVFNDADPFQLL